MRAIAAHAEGVSKERAAKMQHEELPNPTQSMGSITAGDAYEITCILGNQTAYVLMCVEGLSVLHSPTQTRPAHQQLTAAHWLSVPCTRLAAYAAQGSADA